MSKDAEQRGKKICYRGTEIQIPQISREEIKKLDSKSELYNAIAKNASKLERITNIHDTDELYFCEDGYIWRDKGDRFIRKFVVETIPAHVTRHGINHVKEVVKAYKTIDLEQLGPPKKKIPVKNGLLDLETLELEEIKPEHYITYKHPVKWRAETEIEEFKKFLDEVTPEKEKQKKLQEFAGYTLMHWGQPFQRLLILVGPEASGKSTFLEILQALHDEEMVNNASIKKIVDTRFEAATLFNKTINIRADLPDTQLNNVGLLKELTGDDYINAEKKGKDSFRFKNKAKLIFSCNRTPTLKYRDRAALRRIELIEFNKTIPEEDRIPNLDKKIIEKELEGILKWAVEGYRRLIEQGGFTASHSEEKTEEILMKWGQPLYRFIFEKCERQADAKVPSKDLYNEYVEYCQETNKSAISQQKVTKKLKRIGINKAQRSFEGQTRQAYIGLKFTDNFKQEIKKKHGKLTQKEEMEAVKNTVKKLGKTTVQEVQEKTDQVDDKRVSEIIRHLMDMGKIENFFAEQGTGVQWLS